ncbi:MAG: tryptophan--tRNA ligase [Streptosporangiaceae bacterium]|jgi:tryptophanyl-tRNA synthetase|nr:tryptophan--tRNA ligase [Actinomycetota bacterium]
MSLIAIPPSIDASQRRSRQLEAEIAVAPGRFRVLTGDRPTGPLHVGHLFGTLLNRVRLQNAGADVMVLIADYQAITDRDAPDSLPALVLGQVADYLAVGIDPERATIFAHSQVRALNQLLIPFLSLVSVAEVARNPTVKDEIAASGRGSTSALMFSYPVHQAADILSCRANLVPVGRDQLPHLEMTRTIARRFNERYSPQAPYFPEPDGLLSDAPLLLGLDGAKMGKSRGNAIALAATADETARLVRSARTDAERHISYDPAARPEVSNLVLLTALCLDASPEGVAASVGGKGAAALKDQLADALIERLRPIRARRSELAGQPGYLRQVLADGAERAQTVADATLARVQALMHYVY